MSSQIQNSLATIIIDEASSLTNSIFITLLIQSPRQKVSIIATPLRLRQVNKTKDKINHQHKDIKEATITPTNRNQTNTSATTGDKMVMRLSENATHSLATISTMTDDYYHTSEDTFSITRYYDTTSITTAKELSNNNNGPLHCGTANTAPKRNSNKQLHLTKTTTIAPNTPLPLNFQPGEYDVICGRGAKAKNHIGNKKFREYLKLHIVEYSKASNSKLDKSLVVSNIVEYFRSNSTNGGGSSNTGEIATTPTLLKDQIDLLKGALSPPSVPKVSCFDCSTVTKQYLT